MSVKLCLPKLDVSDVKFGEEDGDGRDPISLSQIDQRKTTLVKLKPIKLIKVH